MGDTKLDPRSLTERFMRYVEPEPMSGCGLWTGAVNEHGYGVFCIGSKCDKSKRNILAHRFAWEQENGSVPKGQRILHRCDTPSCVEPSHLYAGTSHDNNMDMAKRARGRKSAAGFPYGVRQSKSWVSVSKPYYAQIKVRGKDHYLGRFSSIEEAALAAVEAKKTLILEVAQ